MEACRECGASLGATDRFCAQCGRPTSSDIEAFGSERTVAADQLVGRGGRGSALLVVATVLAIFAGLAWLTGGSSSDDGIPSTDDRSDEESTDRTTTPTERRGTSQTTTDLAPDDRPDTENRATTSTSLAEDGPLLDHETGLALLSGGANLRRVDLDTGLVTEYELRGVPVLQTGGWLALTDPNGGRTFAVPLDDPDGGTMVELPQVAEWPPAVSAGPESGTAWFHEPGDETFELIHVDLSDGTVLERREATETWWFGFSSAPGGLASMPDGSIFASTDGGYERLDHGGLLAYNDELMLVTNCDAPDSCVLTWIERATGQPTERFLPPSDEIYVGGWLSPSGRLLTLYSKGPRPPSTFDVERGEVIDELPGLFSGELAISPDERYVAMVEVNPIIVDLDTGNTFTIPVSTQGYNRVLLVDSP